MITDYKKTPLEMFEQSIVIWIFWLESLMSGDYKEDFYKDLYVDGDKKEYKK